MIGFKINGEWLKLNPETILELDGENPLFQLSDEIQGEFSLPFTIPMTEENMRLLGYINNFQTSVKNNNGIKATLYCDGVEHSTGVIRIEQRQSNINDPSLGSISAFYLYGTASFYNDVENKFLTDMNYGDDYSIPKGSFAIEHREDENIYWGYITKIMREGNPDNSNFAIFPVINWGDTGNYAPAFMKFQANVYNSFVIKVSNNKPVIGVQPYSYANYGNDICPFPYLHYVIKQIFKTLGWQLKAPMLDEVNFKKKTLICTNHIKSSGNNPVVWNLKNHVPKVKISTFLIALSNRFGWWLKFDYKRKICEIKYRNDFLKNRTKVNCTNIAGAEWKSKIREGKIYSLVSAAGDTRPDFNQLNYQGELNNVDELPAANSISEGHLYFIKGENSYYFCGDGEEEGQLKWIKSADNIFDHIPEGANEEIKTNCLVPETSEMMLIQNSNSAVTNSYFVMPMVNIFPGNGETETFYICNHYGLVNSLRGTTYQYPGAGAGAHDLHGNKKADPLVFEYPEEEGLYKKNWEYFLSLIKQKEEITIPLQFTLQDILNLDYEKSILIKNVEFFLKNPHLTLPLKDFQQVELIRL